jgi:hypothetical protein
MRLSDDEAMRRLGAALHGVLATMHPQRGVEAVPAVFALDRSSRPVIPIDLVKPKAAGPLQRELNLAADPRATLLIDHWHAEDWSQLWWVRVQLHHEATLGRDDWGDHAEHLARRYPQYRDHPFARLLVFRVDAITGWAASDG